MNTGQNLGSGHILPPYVNQIKMILEKFSLHTMVRVGSIIKDGSKLWQKLGFSYRQGEGRVRSFLIWINRSRTEKGPGKGCSYRLRNTPTSKSGSSIHVAQTLSEGAKEGQAQRVKRYQNPRALHLTCSPASLYLFGSSLSFPPFPLCFFFFLLFFFYYLGTKP